MPHNRKIIKRVFPLHFEWPKDTYFSEQLQMATNCHKVWMWTLMYLVLLGSLVWLLCIGDISYIALY